MHNTQWTKSLKLHFLCWVWLIFLITTSRGQRKMVGHQVWAGLCTPRKMLTRNQKRKASWNVQKEYHTPFVLPQCQLSFPGSSVSFPVHTIYMGHRRTIISEVRELPRGCQSWWEDRAAGKGLVSNSLQRTSRQRLKHRNHRDVFWISAGSHDCKLHVSTLLLNCALTNSYKTLERSSCITKKPCESHY